MPKIGELKNPTPLSSQSKKTTHDKFEKVIATHFYHELCFWKGNHLLKSDLFTKKLLVKQLFCQIYLFCRYRLEIKELHKFSHILVVIRYHLVRREVVKPGPFGAVDVIY